MNLQGLNRLVDLAGRLGAQTAGRETQVYRANSTTDPIVAANLIETKLVYFSPLKDKNPVVHGAALWAVNMDRTTTQAGDYLVQGGTTYFVVAMQDTLSVSAAQCNAKVKIVRPGTGASGYSGYTPSTGGTVLASNKPASFLVQGKGDRSELDLPLDSKMATWTVLMPALQGVTVQSNDQLHIGTAKYNIISSETSELGLRLSVQTLKNGA